MKKITIFVLVFVLLAALAVLPVNAAEDFDYVHIVASDNDPYAEIEFNENGNHMALDPDLVKWAVIKYRTITEKDSSGSTLIGQFYVMPADEPYIPIKYNHTQQWETLVIDLTSVSEKTTLTSKWDSAHYGNPKVIRFDPLESSRNAEDNDSENDKARVQSGDCIDVAYIAFFTSEADAKAYDGTQNTPYCIILPDDLYYYDNGHEIEDIKIVKAGTQDTEAETTEAASETEVETEALTETETEAVTETETEVVTEAETEEKTESETTSEPVITVGADEQAKSGLPGWAIALIVVAGAAVVAVVIALVAKKKK